MNAGGALNKTMDDIHNKTQVPNRHHLTEEAAKKAKIQRMQRGVAMDQNALYEPGAMSESKRKVKRGDNSHIEETKMRMMFST